MVQNPFADNCDMSGEHDGAVVSPMSTGTAQPYRSLHSDPEANAPEVVDISSSPYHYAQSPSVVSPTVTGSSPGTVHSTAYSPAVPGQHYDQGKEVFHGYTDYPQVVGDLNAKDQADKGAAAPVAGGEAVAPGGAGGKKILGMRRTVFFIVLAVICIVIAVAVGAGVGATMSSNNKSKSPGEAKATPTGDHTGSSGYVYLFCPQYDPCEIFTLNYSSSSSSSSPSGSSAGGSSKTSSPGSSPSTSPTKSSDSASSSGSPTTSAATPTPTFLNQTTLTNDQGWGFQGFADTGFAGDYTSVFLNDADFVETEKGLDFKITVNSYQWLQKGTNCCISFCNNNTHAGWVGYQCQAKKQPKTTYTFTRVWVWCSDDHQQPNAERCGPS